MTFLQGSSFIRTGEAQMDVDMRFPDRPLESIADLLAKLRDDQFSLESEGMHTGAAPVWFRGLPDSSYKLLPSMYHPDKILDGLLERFLMNRFKQNAHQFLDFRPQGEWEWLFLMRHYGLPSRLLDWTESPLVALYFAIHKLDQSNRATSPANTDGSLWCLLPTILNGEAKSPNPIEIPMFSDDEAYADGDQSQIDNYRPSRINWPTDGSSRRGGSSGRLSSAPPLAGLAIRTSRRIQAQQGVFTIHHSDPMPVEEVGNGRHSWRYIIPKEKKEDLAKELQRLRVNTLSVFPDLDNVAAYAEEVVRATLQHDAP